jgi:hypothetical protein
MAISFKIPALDKSFYQDKSVPQIKDRIKFITDKYGSIIDNVANLTNLNKDIIKSFIFIESRGEADAQSPYAVGLMQVGLATASDGLVLEKSSGRLSSGEEAILSKYLGARMSNLDKLKKNQKSIGKTWITKSDLFKPEFNILVGSIILKQLIDEFTEDGVPRLDKVAVLYNAGRYGKIGKMTIAHKGSTEELHSKLPKEPSSYITKLLGVNSTLDILT